VYRFKCITFHTKNSRKKKTIQCLKTFKLLAGPNVYLHNNSTIRKHIPTTTIFLKLSIRHIPSFWTTEKSSSIILFAVKILDTWHQKTISLSITIDPSLLTIYQKTYFKFKYLSPVYCKGPKFTAVKKAKSRCSQKLDIVGSR